MNSHLIPQALTKPSKKGGELLQLGHRSRPTRRWSSWYDSELVIREGEDVLSALDDWAIAELRKHKIVWSGWGQAKELGNMHKPLTDRLGVRVVEMDTSRLRMFFLSLLWRAAATSRYEFSQVELPEADIERLRRFLLGLEGLPISSFPIQLIQLSTKGFMHNQSPYKDLLSLPRLDDNDAEPHLLDTFRFYFDGLIAHFFLGFPESYQMTDVGGLVVGNDSKLVITTVPFETSLQFREMRNAIHRSPRS